MLEKSLIAIGIKARPVRIAIVIIKGKGIQKAFTVILR